MPSLPPFAKGMVRVHRFCAANGLPRPSIREVDKTDWAFAPTCAYYRPDEGVKICLPLCARPATEAPSRNWNWPGSTTDREPYGVICHELGHHLDWLLGEKKGAYYSDFSLDVMQESGEKPITSYAPSPAEWFAEIARLFVTNHALLRELRPKAYAIIRERLIPVSDDDWVKELGPKVPQRIVTNLQKKIRRR